MVGKLELECYDIRVVHALNIVLAHTSETNNTSFIVVSVRDMKDNGI